MTYTRLVIAFMLLLGWVTAPAQETQVRPCTQQDLPDRNRERYINRARELIQTYYDQLLFCVGDLEVQETFIDSYMIEDGRRYMPEFLAGTDGTAQHLTPAQYLQELDKAFAGTDTEALALEIRNLTIKREDFYMFNMVSLYVVARYNLTLRDGEKIIFSRDCEAYCLFPKASVSILVKLMQLNPTSPGTFAAEALPQQTNDNRPHDIQVTSDNLPEPDNKPRVVSHHPDLEFNVLKVYTDNDGFWIEVNITNVSDRDHKVIVNTGLRAYDDAGNIYSELQKFSDNMCMYVGNSKQHTNWNAQQQSVLLPSGVPIKLRIFIGGMPKSAKGIRRLDWSLYSESMGMKSWNSLVAQIYDIYSTVGDKLARPSLIPDMPGHEWGQVTSSCPGLKLHIARVRSAGGTCFLDFYIVNTTRKDGWLTPHYNIKVYDNMGNVYESGVVPKWGSPHLYVGFDKEPVNWDGQTGMVKLPPGIPVKLRMELNGVDPDANALTRILWTTFSEDFSTSHNRPTFTLTNVKLK